ncbi:hypothetical protein DSCO28_66700 [Desulfosarcina ovata subsp. sediminis]|uniref:histidine kinase n=1 Tax=Desulfosarcina ovata subsp. sediminis TaxID=885957 RepID=A0A5K8A145_9BACT|nr:ATP-binding protein [Desulfosarcina ovata]BBO86104.1 hypothetical protein DSCO28_66700 [Desulfosarcina ovata subsp. sediminis]
MKLNAKLSMLFFLLTVIPVCVVGYLSFQNGRMTIRENVVDHLQSINLHKKAEFERWVRDNARVLELLAGMPFFRQKFPHLLAARSESGPDRVAAHATILDHLKPTVDGGLFWELFIIRADDGRVMLSTDENQEGKFLDDQPYFIEGRHGTFIQNVYYAMSIQKPAMTISTPLVNAENETIAVLAGRLDLSELSGIMEKHSELGQSMDTYLVNKFNFYVTEPRFGRGYALAKSIHTQGVTAALARKKGVGYYRDYRGVPVIGAYQWMPEWELCLITEVDQKDAYAPVLSFRKTVLSIALAISLVAAGFGWISAYTVTTPLRRLVEATEEVGSGRLDAAMDTGGRGEVADLARSFTKMIERLATTLVSRDALLAEVEERKNAEALREQALEELKRSNEELQQFAYVASHDLQEPLRMVSSYTQLLANRYEDKLDDKAKKFIRYAVDGALRMQQLIQDLLSFSRVTTHGDGITTVDSRSAVDNAMTNLQAAIAETGAEISCDPLPVVSADAAQLVQLFQNLIKNAIKFRDEVVPHIRIWAEKDGHAWQFNVADNGIGIEEQYKERIFVIFQRLHTRSEYPGTGIGLAICKRIVERHGGRIWFSSIPGNGTVFHFTLKAAPENG